VQRFVVFCDCILLLTNVHDKDMVKNGAAFDANYGNSQGCSGTSCHIARTAEASRGVSGSYQNGNFQAEGSARVVARATGEAQASADLRNGRLRFVLC
jgi:hypothetical protein